MNAPKTGTVAEEASYDYSVVADYVHHGPKVIAKCAAGGDAFMIAKLLADHIGEPEVVTSYRAVAKIGSRAEEFGRHFCGRRSSSSMTMVRPGSR